MLPRPLTSPPTPRRGVSTSGACRPTQARCTLSRALAAKASRPAHAAGGDPLGDSSTPRPPGWPSTSTRPLAGPDRASALSPPGPVATPHRRRRRGRCGSRWTRPGSTAALRQAAAHRRHPRHARGRSRSPVAPSHACCPSRGHALQVAADGRRGGRRPGPGKAEIDAVVAGRAAPASPTAEVDRAVAAFATPGRVRSADGQGRVAPASACHRPTLRRRRRACRPTPEGRLRPAVDGAKLVAACCARPRPGSRSKPRRRQGAGCPAAGRRWSRPWSGDPRTTTSVVAAAVSRR